MTLKPVAASGRGHKRLHDRNKSGWWLRAFWLLPFALFIGGFSIVFFDDPKTGRSGDFSTGSILIFRGAFRPRYGASSSSASAGRQGA